MQVDEETLSELKEAFELFDTGRNNSIDARELKAAMRAFGIEARKDDVRNSMKSIGKDINETLVFEEFVKIMAPKLVSNKFNNSFVIWNRAREIAKKKLKKSLDYLMKIALEKSLLKI